jgi:NAD+ kinase
MVFYNRLILAFFLEGDHIKVTASKYPFPTVCADKQSTDWFHAISRTLKWNERERQKSFVVVEEGPAKRKKRDQRSTPTAGHLKVAAPQSADESPADEEEDEDSDEDDKFDIDDSSVEADSASEASRDEPLGRGVAPDIERTPFSPFARKRRSKSRSRSRPSVSRPYHSGVDSPSRFAGPQPPLTRHVGFELPKSSSADSSLSDPGLLAAQQGFRDELHSTKQMSGKSRIPKDRGVDTEAAKTPTNASLAYGRGRGHSRTRSAEHHARRAFAVWGHDESDSNASESDA